MGFFVYTLTYKFSLLSFSSSLLFSLFLLPPSLLSLSLSQLFTFRLPFRVAVSSETFARSVPQQVFHLLFPFRLYFLSPSMSLPLPTMQEGAHWESENEESMSPRRAMEVFWLENCLSISDGNGEALVPFEAAELMGFDNLNEMAQRLA